MPPILEGQSGYLLPNMEVQINFHNTAAGSCFPPAWCWKSSRPNRVIRQRTATNSFKPAKMETGYVQVPGFVSAGEKIRVSTDSGSYLNAPDLTGPGSPADRGRSWLDRVCSVLLEDMSPAARRAAACTGRPAGRPCARRPQDLAGFFRDHRACTAGACGAAAAGLRNSAPAGRGCGHAGARARACVAAALASKPCWPDTRDVDGWIDRSCVRRHAGGAAAWPR